MAVNFEQPGTAMASLQKINGNYYAYFYDSDRRPKRKSYPLRVSLKSAAKKYKNRLEREYAEGDFDPWNPGPRTELLSLEEAGERFLENRRQRLRSSSVRSYEIALRGLRRTASTGVLLPDVSAEDLRAYILAPDIAQATQAKRYRHLLAFFNWSQEEGLVERNPMDDVKRPKAPRKVPEYLTPPQVDHLLATMDRCREEAKTKPGRTPNVQWLKDIIEIAVSTGLRRSALVALHWSDVDLEGGQLVTRNRDGFTTKSGHEQGIPIAPDARTVLERLWEERGEEGGPVLRSATGLPLDPDTVSRRFKEYLRKADLPEHISFHSLRHTCATWLAASGTPSRIIQEIMGHGQLSTTEIYMHAASGPLQSAMDQTFNRRGSANEDDADE